MDAFLGEIRAFPFTFPPLKWAFCDGQLMPISQNTALFSLLGTFYGGDGKSTFALPDLQNSVAIGTGQGQAMSERFLGEPGGAAAVQLLESEIPAHTHGVSAANFPGDIQAPRSDVAVARSTGGNAYHAAPQSLVLMSPSAHAPAGGSQPHNNLMPYLTLNFCICILGIFPTRP